VQKLVPVQDSTLNETSCNPARAYAPVPIDIIDLNKKTVNFLAIYRI